MRRTLSCAQDVPSIAGIKDSVTKHQQESLQELDERPSTRDMVGIQEVAKYGRLSGVRVGTTEIVRFAQAFGAKGLRIESPYGISSTLKKALAMLASVLVGVAVDYRDNHRLVEIVHPEALN